MITLVNTTQTCVMKWKPTGQLYQEKIKEIATRESPYGI